MFIDSDMQLPVPGLPSLPTGQLDLSDIWRQPQRLELSFEGAEGPLAALLIAARENNGVIFRLQADSTDASFDRSILLYPIKVDGSSWQSTFVCSLRPAAQRGTGGTDPVLTLVYDRDHLEYLSLTLPYRMTP